MRVDNTRMRNREKELGAVSSLEEPVAGSQIYDTLLKSVQKQQKLEQL
jgi:hypothetical protein